METIVNAPHNVQQWLMWDGEALKPIDVSPARVRIVYGIQPTPTTCPHCGASIPCCKNAKEQP